MAKAAKPRSPRRKPIALATADTHLQDRAWASRPELCGDAYHSFQQIVDRAVEENLTILAMGDLIDRQLNESKVPAFIREQMNRLQRAHVHFKFTQGQHERQPFPWFCSVHEWPDWIHDRTFEVEGVPMWALDWQPAAVLPEKLDQMPEGTAVLGLHQVCDEFMGSLAHPELSFSMLPNVGLLVVGDYHVHKQLKAKNRESRLTTVLSPGSTAMQSKDEPSEKRIFRIYDDLSVESVLLLTRQMLRPPPIEEEAHLESFLAEIDEQLKEAWQRAADDMLPDSMRKPMIEVTYNPLLAGAYRRIAKAIGGEAHIFWTDKMPVRAGDQERKEVRKVVVAKGMLGCLDTVCDAEQNPELHAYVQELLTPSNMPSMVVAAWRKKFDLEEVEEVAVEAS